MEGFSFSLNRTARLQRFALIRFFDLLHLHLTSCYELSHAWNQTVELVLGQSPDPIYHTLKNNNQGVEEHLLQLSQDPIWKSHAAWFQVLGSLYSNGAGMSEAVKGIATSLRKEDAGDLENHLRGLPTKMQVVLILFFFPPTVLLLILPILSALRDLSR